MNRKKRAELAQETLTIIEQGCYVSPQGRKINIQPDLNECRQGTRLYEWDEGEALDPEPPSPPQENGCSIAVTHETTLGAAFRLKTEMPAGHIVCLNFASAMHPGGGFINGSQAQEESLARSSALYAALVGQDRYYRYHRKRGTALYSDRMIFSPNVPVFRNDDGRLIAPYYRVSMITSAAVNAGAVRKNSPDMADRIIPAMRMRMEKVLRVAKHHKADGLILGAWGCGVFRNEPEVMARLWFEHLVESQAFNQSFQKVVFAIPGKATENYTSFADQFVNL